MSESNNIWIVFMGGKLLLRQVSAGSYDLPRGATPPVPLPDKEHVNVFELSGHIVVRSFAAEEATPVPEDMELVGLRQSYFLLPPKAYGVAGKMEELVYWDHETKFCGRCGGKLEYSTPISKKCCRCGHEIWPSLQVAAITLVKRGDKILLVRARTFRSDFMGLVAGFVETGETLEHAAIREIMEETRLKVKNLRYFGSQAWPYPLTVMAGFVADYDSGEIEIQKSELIEGGWYGRDELPILPDKASIARRMIDAWIDGKI